MNAPHGFLSFDLAQIQIRDAIARAERARLVASANRQHGRPDLIRSVRRLFGSAIVGLGRRVEGREVAQLEAIDIPTAGVLRIAR